MVNTWTAAALSGGAALLAGQSPWEHYQRRQHHTRVAARRLHGQAQTELYRLAGQTRVRQEPFAGPDVLPDQTASIFGPDLIADFYRVVIAELQTWADEAAVELEHLRGRRLAARRTALRNLRAEIRVLCAEIEEQEERWGRSGITEALQEARFSAGLWHLELNDGPGPSGAAARDPIGASAEECRSF